MSKKVYSRPELSAYGEFANLTQRTGSGFADFEGSTDTGVGTVTTGADPNTSVINTPTGSVNFTPAS
ncbi:hypothetical protein Riv7116_0467 [Rivularia sp. PCC 7116]|uniref:hypothetical protein n=1 Tax=Rivularia sp. PCC 7116 TaxID=373994 RepID=UPI00029F0F9C|nr:hypothetical protein [Rivularia sp. PCC 7116]AFY53068.1 hypothetical protein Riv7116_0467 [Rivularia sp. PCC 7116]